MPNVSRPITKAERNRRRDLFVDPDVLAESERQASWRAACAASAKRYRWTYFARLTWAYPPVDEIVASKDIERWATRFRRRIPGSAVSVGLHSDTGRIHAHAFVFLPRCGAPPKPPPNQPLRQRVWRMRGVATTWFEEHWKRGKIWLDLYRPYNVRGDPKHHGAAAYLAKQPDTVMQFGVPPLYHPRRKR